MYFTMYVIALYKHPHSLSHRVITQNPSLIIVYMYISQLTGKIYFIQQVIFGNKSHIWIYSNKNLKLTQHAISYPPFIVACPL